MNEEEVQKFTEQLAQARAEMENLNRATSSMATGMSGFAQAMAKAARDAGVASPALDKIAQGAGAAAKAIGANTAVVDANTQAQQQYNQALGALKGAAGAATAALFSVGKALVSGEAGFNKYGDAVGKAADGAADLAGEFGVLGKILGMIIKAGAEVVKAQLKQADDVIKGVDKLNKLGAAGTLTGDQLVKMGHNAGYTTAQLEKLTKPIESMKGGLVALGGTAGQGVKEFGKLAAVSRETRESFRRLGISQEELTQNQADYVALQRMSGRMITQQSKDSGALQKASLDYTKNLVELSAITGKSVEEAKRELEATQATYTRQIQNAKESAELARLQKVLSGDASAAEKERAKVRMAEIESAKKGRDEMDKALSSMGLDEAAKAAYQTFMETGVKTKEFNDTFGQLNVDFDKQRQQYRETGKFDSGEFLNEMRSGVLEQTEKFGDYLQIGGEDAGKSIGAAGKMVAWAAGNAGNDFSKAIKDSKQQIADAAAGKGPVGEDPVQKARNTEAESAIKVAVELDKLAWATNPIAHGYFPDLGAASEKLKDMMEKLAIAVGIAVAAMAGFKAAKGIAALASGAAKAVKAAGGVLARVGGAAARAAPGAARAATGAVGGAARAASKFGKFIPGVGMVLTAGMAAADAYQGYTNAEKTLGLKEGEKATTGQKLSAAAGSALSGLTFGLISPETISKGIANAVGAGSDTTAKAVQKATDAVAKSATTAKAVQKATDAVTKSATTQPNFEKRANTMRADELAQKTAAENKARMEAMQKEMLAKFGSDAFKATGMMTAKDMELVNKFNFDKTAGLGAGIDVKSLLGDKASFSFGDPQSQKLLGQLASVQEKLNLKSEDPLAKLQARLNEQQIKLSEKGNSALGSVNENLSKLNSTLQKANDPQYQTGSLASLSLPFTGLLSSMFGGGAFGAAGGMMGPAGGGGGGGGGKMGSMAGSAGGGGVAKFPGGDSAGGGGGGGSVLGGLWSGLMGLVGQGGDKGGPEDSAEGRVSGGGGGGADPKDATKSGLSAAHGPRKTTKGLVVHHTGGRGLQTAIDTLKTRGLGYHYLIDRDGSVVNYVDDNQKAYHAGKTDKKPDVNNSNSVGMAIVAKDDKDVTKEQIQAGFLLGQKLMGKYGISSIYGHGETSGHKHPEEGKTLAQAIRTGKIEAKLGGLASGPESGYPATLHGNEMIVPLDANSILAEMGKKTKQELENEMKAAKAIDINPNADAMKEMSNINRSLMEMLANKLDNMINKLDTSNDTQQKLLKYSQA